MVVVEAVKANAFALFSWKLGRIVGVKSSGASTSKRFFLEESPEMYMIWQKESFSRVWLG